MLAQPNPYNQTFTAFESGQVRPLAITPDKKYLLAVNTPDAKLEIFKIKNDGLEHRVSLPVGMEPVSVAVRNNEEAWVVNHLSDSVSIVSLNDKDSRVKRTLLVGDEPRDIVFAGQNRSRAFITTAHRGQNSPIDPQLTTPGVGRADVWVFDANLAGSATSLGGQPLKILTFFADTPRALAVTPDGKQSVCRRILQRQWHCIHLWRHCHEPSKPAAAVQYLQFLSISAQCERIRSTAADYERDCQVRRRQAGKTKPD